MSVQSFDSFMKDQYMNIIYLSVKVYFGYRRLLVTILKHPEHYYKIIAFDVATNEEFTLNINRHDIIERASTPTVPYNYLNSHSFLNYILENDIEISKVIMESLTLIKKETQNFIV